LKTPRSLPQRSTNKPNPNSKENQYSYPRPRADVQYSSSAPCEAEQSEKHNYSKHRPRRHKYENFIHTHAKIKEKLCHSTISPLPLGSSSARKKGKTK
jgi:hypothetical protein